MYVYVPRDKPGGGEVILTASKMNNVIVMIKAT